ncbi:MAG: major facilitator superfamily 1, partial [Phenylobacterium sp.]|nr:major facilitator superfamily 1 [Phenylobacterium sp.]
MTAVATGRAKPKPKTAEPATYSTRGSQLYGLFLLFAIYTCHSVDRGIFGIVTEPIRREFHASDSQLGLITMCYTLAFCAAMLPLGFLIDRLNRIRLLTGLVAIWSVFTALAGVAGGMSSLLLARAGVGAAEAGGHPISMSLISDIIPLRRRGAAVGLFYVATGLGGVIIFLGGGFIAAKYGWRAAFFMAGVPGLLLGLVALATLREPRRGAHEDAAHGLGPAPPLGKVLLFILATPAVLNLAISAMLVSSVNGSYHLWLSSFFVRAHGLDLKQVGVIGALGPGILQAAGALGSGFLADWLGRRHPHRVGYVATGAIFMMAPLGVIYTQTPSLSLAIALVLAMGVFAGAWMAPTFTLLLSITEPRMRGVVVGVVQVMSALGAGFGPFVVGVISDRIGGGLHNA